MVNDRAMTGHFGGWGNSQNYVGTVDARNGKLTPPSQVDNDLLKFNQVGGCTGWYRELNALTDANNQTTTHVLSCAAAILVPTHRVKARDLWGWIILDELRFLDQRQVNSVIFQDDCKPVLFCSQGITVPL